MTRYFVMLFALSVLATSAHAQSDSLQRSWEYAAKQVEVAEAECRKGVAVACARLAGWYHIGRGVSLDLRKAVAFSVRACELGRMGSCADAAFGYLNYEGVRDEAQAARRYSQACDGGVEKACHELGLLYEGGVGVAADRGKAEALFARACTAGVDAACGKVAGADVDQLARACRAEQWDACRRAAEMYASGQGVAADPAKAAGVYERLCAARDMGACAKSATQYRLAGDSAKAVAIASEACSDPLAPHAESCTILGEHHQMGEGVERSAFGALVYYNQACHREHARGCFRLAALTTDPAERLERFEKACTLRHVPACHALAQHYEQSENDPVTAAGYMDQACRLGNAEGCTYLAAFHGSGKSTQPDASKSASYAERGCEGGVVQACLMLASLYNGFLDGIEPDRERVIAALERALEIDPGNAAIEQDLKTLRSGQ